MMAEAIMISVFLMLLLVLQLKEQREIKIKAAFSWVRAILTVVLAVALLVIFWQDQLANQLKLGAFAIMIVSFGFLREGLGSDHLIKLGVLAGEYTQYVHIQLEESNEQTFVTFYKKYNNHFSILFPEKISTLETYFASLGLEEKIVIGEMSVPEVKRKTVPVRNRRVKAKKVSKVK